MVTSAILLAGMLSTSIAEAPPTAFASAATQLRRYPYLTDVVAKYATINWGTDRSVTAATVKYGVAGSGSCTGTTVAGTGASITVNGSPEYQWKALLTLTPNTAYCYRVYLGSVDLLGSDPSPTFMTQLPEGSSSSFSFAVFGDWGSVDSGGNNAHQANLLAQLAKSGVRFALTAGDNGYPSGSQSNYGDLVQTGSNLSGVFGKRFWAVAGARIPLFPAIGNHGFSRSESLHPQFANWPQDRAVAGSAGRYLKQTYCCKDGTSSGSYPSAWYAFSAGSARFYVLDAAWNEANVGTASNYKVDRDYHWTSTSAEYLWLQKDLNAHPGGLKFAVFHYPIYSDNSTEPSDTYLQGASSLEGLLASHGVQMAFSGHSHIYQRNKKSPLGLITYVTGGGGARLEPIGAKGCSAIDAYGIGWSYSANGGRGAGSACGAATKATSQDHVFHFLKVKVVGMSVTVTPIDEMGRAFDVQTYKLAAGVSSSPQSPLR